MLRLVSSLAYSIAKNYHWSIMPFVFIFYFIRFLFWMPTVVGQATSAHGAAQTQGERAAEQQKQQNAGQSQLDPLTDLRCKSMRAAVCGNAALLKMLAADVSQSSAGVIPIHVIQKWLSSESIDKFISFTLAYVQVALSSLDEDSSDEEFGRFYLAIRQAFLDAMAEDLLRDDTTQKNGQ